MKILITMRTADANEYHEPRQAISMDWISLCQRFGYIPILVPAGLNNYREYFDLDAKGLILTGGDSLGSLAYESHGAKPSLRDQLEHALIEETLKRKLPILGVCRGLQVLNTYFGGSLVRNLKANHVGFHQIVFTKPIYGLDIGDSITVNSFHNHGVYEPELAKDFEMLAKSDDGCVEYIEHKHLPITAINWHPERENGKASELDAQIFNNRFKT